MIEENKPVATKYGLAHDKWGAMATVFGLVDKIQKRTDASHSGYVKPWKNNSLVWTFIGLKSAGADLTYERINTHVYNAYQMEGVDVVTIDDVSSILFKFFS
jgi:hypothetical protein